MAGELSLVVMVKRYSRRALLSGLFSGAMVTTAGCTGMVLPDSNTSTNTKTINHIGITNEMNRAIGLTTLLYNGEEVIFWKRLQLDPLSNPGHDHVIEGPWDGEVGEMTLFVKYWKDSDTEVADGDQWTEFSLYKTEQDCFSLFIRIMQSGAISVNTMAPKEGCPS